MENNLDPLAYKPPPLLSLDPRSAGTTTIQDEPRPLNPAPVSPMPTPQAMAAQSKAAPNAPPAAPGKPLYTAWSRLGPKPPAPRPNATPAPVPPPKPTLQGFQIPQNRDGAAAAKMALLRDQVVTPALTETLPHTRAILAEILRGAPANLNGHAAGRWNMVQRVFYWVRSRVRYVRDPHNNKELFQALGVTLKNGLGDCDDFTGALAALLKACGFRVKARVIAERPGPFVHIYPLVEIGGKWIALDATTNNPPGWAPRHSRALEMEL